MGAVTILLVKIAFKTYLSSLSLILTWPIRSELFTCARVKTNMAGMDVWCRTIGVFSERLPDLLTPI